MIGHLWKVMASGRRIQTKPKKHHWRYTSSCAQTSWNDAGPIWAILSPPLWQAQLAQRRWSEAKHERNLDRSQHVTTAKIIRADNSWSWDKSIHFSYIAICSPHHLAKFLSPVHQEASWWTKIETCRLYSAISCHIWFYDVLWPLSSFGFCARMLSENQCIAV